MLSVVPSGPVVVRAPAKINLHLGVGHARPDGFHELTTVFHAVSLTDTVTLAPADEMSLVVRGQGAAEVPTDASNLAWRAVSRAGEEFGRVPRVRIEIDKDIPVAGGMAGGSADAAAALLAATRLWRETPGPGRLDELAATLGSDVPFSLHGGTELGSGRGERLTTVLARGRLHWVVAVARGGLSTPAVYGELDRLRAEGAGGRRLGPPTELLAALAAGDARRVAPLLGNDLQVAAVSLMPTLRRTLRAGVDAGALAGIVSGSGPTCVFLCADETAAVNTAAELAGAGVCRAVRVAHGPVPGASVVD